MKHRMIDQDDDEVRRYRAVRDRLRELAAFLAEEERSSEDRELGRRAAAWARVLDPRQEG
jgi:hypothetical protein